jgi:hypothetical protein
MMPMTAGAADKGKFLVTGFHSEVVLLSARLTLQTGDGGLSITGDDNRFNKHDERGNAEGTPDVTP